MTPDHGGMMDRRGQVPAKPLRRVLAFALAPLGAGFAAVLIGTLRHLLERGLDPAFAATGAVLGAGVFAALHVLRIMDDPGIRLAPLGAACGLAAALLSWCIDVRPDRRPKDEN